MDEKGKHRVKGGWRVAAVLLLLLPFLYVASAGPAVENTAMSPDRDATAAARLAAALANEKCRKQWRQEPFYRDLYTAEFRAGRWYWGEYDPAGPDGFSAEVSFRRDGSDPRIQINFSTDTEADWNEGHEEDETIIGPTEAE